MIETGEPEIQKSLLAEIGQLRQTVDRLQQANQDLQIALTTTAEHGDLIEAQLQETNRQLQAEVLERQRAEATLRAFVDLISDQKNDLEIILQTITEHGDILDAQWYEKVRQANLLAGLDGLTQIANRRRFDEYLEQQWKQMSCERSPLSIILCDIDCFKQFNDTYGHLSGDECLKKIARVLSHTFNCSMDLVSRYGGEEFAAILPQTDIHRALKVTQKLQRAVRQLLIFHARSTVSEYITLSIGLASTVPDYTQSPNTLLDEADRLLYLAKQQGRNQIVHTSLH
jgi:diguanylate cyclase (GGDEF)-like protein